VTISDSDIQVFKDRTGLDEWRVEYFDAEGGCFVTIFSGPTAEERARAYERALAERQLNMFPLSSI
jgi:hypothetical protein